MFLFENKHTWNKKGIEFFSEKKYDAALDCFNHALSIDSSDGMLWHNKGKALYYLERFDEALECTNGAVKIKPNSPEAWTVKGSILIKLGQYKEAIDCFNRALGIRPGFTDATQFKTDAQNALLAEEQKLKPETIDKKIIPYISQLMHTHKDPLMMLDNFFKYLELEGFNLPPATKDLIRTEIQSRIDENEKAREKEQLKTLLFKANTPDEAFSTKKSVIPVSIPASGSACQVCLSEFSSAEPGAVKCPHCGNEFHYRCITKWVNKNHCCPICKKELSV